MMLDKAIKTQEQIAKKMEEIAESLRLNGQQDDDIVHDFLALAGYYHQLAAWLKELKDRRDFINIVIDALKEDAEIRPWDYSPYDAISLIKALGSEKFKRKSKKAKEEELIRRKDAIAALGEEPENWQAVFDWRAYVAAINAVPAADKNGEWIYNPEDYAYGNPNGSYECSRCGESVPDKTNFCPECGSDNRGKMK